LWSAPVAFRRVALETPEWTSRDSNHHRQSVSAGKTNAIPTEPSGRLTKNKKIMEKPGDELQFLKRCMVLQHDYRLETQTHHRRPDGSVGMALVLPALVKPLVSPSVPTHPICGPKVHFGK